LIFLTDSHCHLHLLDPALPQNELAEIMARAQAKGVHYILNVSVNLNDFSRIQAIANTYSSSIGLSVGLHPNYQDEEIDEATLIKLGALPEVIAMGETGLDYFRSSGDLHWQQERFRLHIRAAKKLKKPLIIHTRQAKEDTIRIMQEENAQQVGGVMHCFTEDWAMAEQALAMGFYISFSGIVTFKNAVTIQDVAKRVPLNKILIETDAPYLAPEPHRGEANEPALVRFTAEYLAKLRGLSLEDFATQTTDNFFTLFKGAVKPHV